MTVTVIGSGLAGLSAAITLLRRGMSVRVLEAAPWLGGKTRSVPFAGGHNGEHGYHIFPTWYVNTWKLIEDVGITGNFTDINNAWSIEAGQYPDFRPLDHGSPRSVLRGDGPSLRSVAGFWLSAVGALDLASQPYARREVDDISVAGFVRSRAYRTGELAHDLGGYVFRSTSGASHEISATTVRNVVRYWMKAPSPFLRIGATNLHEAIVAPLCAEIERLGGTIHTRQPVVGIELEAGVARRIRIQEADGVRREAIDQLVLTIPPDRLLALLDADFLAASPQLSDLAYLRAAPMASMTILFKPGVLSGLVKEHVYLKDSPLHLSFIDQWANWGGEPGRLINVVASDFTPLRHLSEDGARLAILDDLRRCIPFTEDDIEGIDFQPNVRQPLTLNTPGSWERRPDVRTGVPNVYLAGDSCKSDADLVCMESAVETGLKAAAALLSDQGRTEPVEIRSPEVPPRWLLAVARSALAPVVTPAALLLRSRDRGAK